MSSNVEFEVIFFLFCNAFGFGKLPIIPREDIVDWTKNEKSKYIDAAGLYYEAVNNTFWYLKGKFVFCLAKSLKNISLGEMKFLRDAKSPWRVRAYMEKFERGQWHVMLHCLKTECLIFVKSCIVLICLGILPYHFLIKKIVLILLDTLKRLEMVKPPKFQARYHAHSQESIDLVSI